MKKIKVKVGSTWVEMIALYVKSITSEFSTYIRRVIADLGDVRNDDFTNSYIKWAKDNGLYSNIRFGWLGAAGSKLRTSGIYAFFTKIYSFVTTNDAAQTTSTSQPYLSGNIAQNEKYGMKNPNGGSNFMTHPTISFAANESWSVTTVLNWNGSDNQSTRRSTIWGNISNTYFSLQVGANRFRFYNGTAYEFTKQSNLLIGKNTVITLTANGLGSLSLYINGSLYETISAITTLNVSLIGYGLTPTLDYYFFGKLHAHIIRSGAPTAAQVLSEYNLLRSYIPEIESVVIGTQTWATSNLEMAATPQGNLIAEMQANANVEKITNHTFDTATGWIAFGESTISSGTANIISTAGAISYIQPSSFTLTVEKWYKLIFDVISTNGVNLTNAVGNVIYNTATTAISRVQYFKATEAQLQFKRNGITNVSLDNIFCEEAGWSDSQNLYDYIYAQTVGTTEAKTYAAVKAAGWWCHYNNDTALGAVYGKILNGYARKLLAMDLVYFNAANPTAVWGYKLPIKTQAETLALNGGNSLKVSGNVYMNDANGTNATGLTLLGHGKRNADGSFTNIKATAGIWIDDTNEALQVNSADNTATIVAASLVEGHAVRLIKT